MKTETLTFVDSLSEAAWISANGVRPIARRINAETARMEWLFPATDRVAALVTAWRERDEMRRLLHNYADRLERERRAIQSAKREDR